MDEHKRKYNDYVNSDNTNETADDNEEITYKYMSIDPAVYTENNNNSFKPRKKSKFSLILIIIILALSVIYVCIYFYSKIGSDSDSNQVQDNNTEEILASELEHYEDKETEITDQELIDILDEKIEILDVAVDDRRTILFDKTRRVSNFSDLDLMLIAVNNVKKTDVSNGSDYCYDLKNQKLEYKASNCEYRMIISYVTANDLQEFYKSMFGFSFSKKEKYDLCPVMLYNKEKDIYYLSYACGGAGYPTNLKYIYKYTESDNAVFVYVSYGVMAGDGSIYTDYNMKKLYKEEDYDFEIDKSNYKEFSKYKFVFEKDEDRLRFIYIQKLEQ